MGCSTSTTNNKTQKIITKERFPVFITECGIINRSNINFVTKSTMLKDTDYVISPHYNADDSQPGMITGTVKQGESFTEAATRELHEELLINVTPESLKCDQTHTHGNRTWKVYVVNATKTKINSILPEPNINQDDRSKKVAVIVRGSFRECADIVSKTRGKQRGEKDIIGTKILKVEFLRGLV